MIIQYRLCSDPRLAPTGHAARYSASMLAKSAVYAWRAQKLVAFRCLNAGGAYVEGQKFGNSAIAKEGIIESAFSAGDR